MRGSGESEEGSGFSTNSSLRPLDVIFEIFAHLTLLDIIRLSRTSRDLHNLLTSRSSEHVWRNARLNVEELPPLPINLNEMQYAKLMFDTVCQVCGTHCYIVYWDCRVRCCKKCACKTLLPRNVLCGQLSPTIKTDIGKFILYVPSDHVRLDGGTTQECFLPSAFKTISDDYEQKVKVLNHEGERVDDEEKLAAWKLSMGAKRTEHQHYTRLCVEYSYSKSRSRSDELQELRDQRRGQIKDRLIESGWGSELDYLRLKDRSSDFWNHKLIKQNKLLTDRAWNQIAPKLLERLQLVRKDRINAILHSRYLALKKLYDNHIFQQNLRKSGYPPFGDFIESHIGYDIIFNTPYDQTLPEDAFDEELKKLPEFIEDWKRRKTQELVEILQKDIPEATMDTLSLAKTVFVCESCDDFIWYSDVFQHPCYSKWSVPSDQDMDHGSSKLHVVPRNKEPTIQIYFSKKKSRNLSLVMQSCGLDPGTTTREDLDSLDVILECQSCSRSGDGTRTFMRWSTALVHMNSRLDHSVTRAELSGQLQQRFLDIEKQNEMSGMLICNHCPETSEGKQEYSTRSGFRDHLIFGHNIFGRSLRKEDWSWGPNASFAHRAPSEVWIREGSETLRDIYKEMMFRQFRRVS
ncbi:hypothetical protein K435DRAFT_464953 [Dendrothele bispora CBS 962.96]|uniref:F-box domain-containing protein n=1 Tax=Dendrothele bispora (strain CBS 962.96) TaxID=1314807 RepID=A0A4S8L0Z4_DENBC|nr:hypothetical protein K435DRAFT_464953 [Dendrothele bispora CBS 962.96]